MHSLSSNVLSRRVLFRSALLVLPGFSLVTLTGCGEEDGQTRTIDMLDMRYEPVLLTVPVGAVVTWNNDSNFVHTVTTKPTLLQDPTLVSAPAGQEFDSGNIMPGESWSRAFDQPGEYRYACIPHEMAGMIAKLIVEQTG